MSVEAKMTGSTPRRVLYATAARDLSGGSRQIVHNVRALTVAGLRVIVAVPAGTEVAEAASRAGAEVVGWDAADPLLRAARRLRAIAAESQSEVVHAYHARAVKVAVLARLLGLRPRLLLNRGVVAPPNPLWGAFVMVADGAIANSAAAAATLTARLAPASRVNVIYNCCPPTAGGPPAATGEDSAPAFGGRALAIAWVGNAHPAKGFDVFADAIRRLRAEIGPSACRAVAVGVGPADRHGMAELAGDAIELTGVVSHDEVRRVLARSDVFVLTSRRRESLPNVVTEAFSAGLPVVATDVGGVSELIRHGANGLLCAPGDATSVARHVAALAANPAERARMGALNRRLAVERLTDAAKAASLLRVYAGGHVVEPPPIAWLDGERGGSITRGAAGVP